MSKIFKPNVSLAARLGMYDLSSLDGLRPGELNNFARVRFADLIQNPVRLGERVLPWVTSEDYEIEVGRVNFRPVAASILGMDSPLPRRPLGTLESREYSLLKMGHKYTMIESEIKKLRDAYKLGRLSPAQWARTRPYAFANALVEGFLDRAEAMRWQALADGVIPLPLGGVNIDYGIPATHQDTLTGTDVWTDTDDADGLSDLLAWDGQIYDDTGRHAEVIFMHRADLNHLLAQDSTKQRLQATFGTTGQQINAANGFLEGAVLTVNQLNAWLALHEIGPVVLYDRRYVDMDDVGNSAPTPTYFLPEGKVVMVAPRPVDGGMSAGVPGASAVGYCADGPVVENSFESGVYIWMAEIDEPFEVAVKGAQWALPVVVDPNTIFQAQVRAV